MNRRLAEWLPDEQQAPGSDEELNDAARCCEYPNVELDVVDDEEKSSDCTRAYGHARKRASERAYERTSNRAWQKRKKAASQDGRQTGWLRDCLAGRQAGWRAGWSIVWRTQEGRNLHQRWGGN